MGSTRTGGLAASRRASYALTITVHNLVAAPSPRTTLRLQNAKDDSLAEADVPPIEAPLNPKPRRAEVEVSVKGSPSGKCRVLLDPWDDVKEVTEVNNRLGVSSPA